MTTRPIRTLRDLAPLAALADPTSARLCDVLAVHGECTATALADRTGLRPAEVRDALLTLEGADLVVTATAPEGREETRWRLATPGTRWRRPDLEDPRAVVAAREAERLQLRRQVEHAEAWLRAEVADGADPAWREAAFAHQAWLHLTPGELSALAAEVLDVVRRWADRAEPQDGVARQATLVVARGAPADP